MGDCVTFPKTFDEFAEEYKILDSKEVYTNGTELIPIFRVKQWLEHQAFEKPTKGTLSINYEGEYKRLKEMCGELECEIRQWEAMNRDYELQLTEKEKIIVGLEGQIKAFKFCVARGNIKDDR